MNSRYENNIENDNNKQCCLVRILWPWNLAL